MGFMDKVKGLLKGREKQVKGGIDTVSNKVEAKVGPKYAGTVDTASNKAKEEVDKLASSDQPAPAAAPASPAVTPAAPPVATTPDTPAATTPEPPATPPPAT